MPIENETQQIKFSDADLPGLYQDADKAALTAQRRYINFIRGDLAVLVVVAAFSIVLEIFRHKADSYGVKASAPMILVIVAILRVIGLVWGLGLALMLAQTRPDSEWYDARALAETAKSLAWRYLAGNKQSEDEFLSSLDTLMHRHEKLARALGGQTSVVVPISPRMTEIRSQPTPVRRDIYLVQRFNDQRAWYSRKAAKNRDDEGHWYAGIVVCQVLALLYAIVWVICLAFKWEIPNAIEFFTIFATSCLSWVQLKQHQQLAQAYSMAAYRLGMLEPEGRRIQTDEELTAFVEKCEQVMSGENSNWYARQHRE